MILFKPGAHKPVAGAHLVSYNHFCLQKYACVYVRMCVGHTYSYVTCLTTFKSYMYIVTEYLTFSLKFITWFSYTLLK